MAEVESQLLSNQTRALLDRVASGERITITVHGRPVAELSPVDDRPSWLSRDQFVQTVLPHQADPGLTADLLSRTGGATTDDLPL